MKTLLTGGTGLVGANLVHLLCSRGERPRLLVRKHSERRALHGSSYDEVQGDVLEPASLQAALEGVERVYHAVGAVRLSPLTRGHVLRENTEGVRNMLAAARAAGVRRLVLVTGVAGVGRGTLEEPADEQAVAEDPERKLRGEVEKWALLASGGGLEVVLAHPTFVLGPYDARPSTGELLRWVARGWVRAWPSGGLNVVNAGDVAEGLSLAMEKGRPGERYLLGGENLSWRALLNLCAEEAGVMRPVVPVPDVLVTRGRRLVGGVVEQFGPEVLRRVSPAFLRALTRQAYHTADKARVELGWRPRPVRWGVREALRWFQEEGMLPRDRPLTPRGVV